MKAFFKSISALGILALLATTSCEKAFFEDNGYDAAHQASFDYLWEQCDKKYSYFDLKGIDWNEVKVRYQDSLDNMENSSDEVFFRVIGNMLSELRDDHVNLISDFNVSRFGVKYLGQDNFDWRIIEDNYLNQQYFTTGPFRHNFIKGDSIAYVRFASFTGSMSNDNWDFIFNKYQFTQGMIVDLRENGGGAVSDVFQLLSYFVKERTLLFHSRLRNGENHNDFSEIEAAYLDPYGGAKYTDKPVVFLTDRGTYSAGSFTSLGTKAIDNITLMGDTTGGGLGVPNGGQLPNGWFYRFSISQTLDLNMDEQYELGVPPDVVALFDWNDLTKDEVIEKAIEKILDI